MRKNIIIHATQEKMFNKNDQHSLFDEESWSSILSPHDCRWCWFEKKAVSSYTIIYDDQLTLECLSAEANQFHLGTSPLLAGYAVAGAVDNLLLLLLDFVELCANPP